MLSAIVGVLIRLALDKLQWLANAVGMSLALVVMQLTQTTHPPGTSQSHPSASAFCCSIVPVVYAAGLLPCADRNVCMFTW